MDTVRWGRSVLEPERGHVWADETHQVERPTVGSAICGAFLVGDLPDQIGDFPKCSACLELLSARGDQS